ncbi:hypothetical protein WA158_003240 [Blastocystis sp. Blastoise]
MVHQMEREMSAGNIHIAISKLMTFVNTLLDASLSPTYNVLGASLPALLYPYMPIFAEETYSYIYNNIYTQTERSQHPSSIKQCKWPSFTKKQDYQIIVQINNKKKDIYTISPSLYDTYKNDISTYVLSQPKIKKLLSSPVKETKIFTKNNRIIINYIL